MSNTIKMNAILLVQNTAAELAACQKRIEHIEWLLSPSRACAPIGAAELATELMMLRHQTQGNLMVDLRAAMRALEVEVSR